MNRRAEHPVIFWLQVASISTMWVFVMGISWWIVHLLLLSHRLHDVPSASVGISIVAIPVFLTGAGVLTYVFFGLRRGAKPSAGPPGEGDRTRPGGGGATVALLGLLAAGGAWAGAVPDDPLDGRMLFANKGCHGCHRIADGGSGIGPDLAAGRYDGSFLDLGAALWNHVPGMSASFEEREASWPGLSEGEAQRLLAFLYFIEYLGRPGDARRGREIFGVRGCSECHSAGDLGAAGGAPDLSELERFASPLFIAQAIWNHGPSMFESMRAARMAPPTFEEGDLADLSAFVRQRSSGPVERVLLTPGNPNRGAALFEAKGCAICHGPAARGGEGGPDLRESDLHRPAEEIAGIMWNHAGEMDARRRALGLAWPRLSTEELADLVAFLYFLPFEDPAGDPVAGAEVFRARSCHECHGAGSAPELADIAAAERGSSAAAFVASMWSHAPMMRETILAEGRNWPELSGNELRDLLAYLAAQTTGSAAGGEP